MLTPVRFVRGVFALLLLVTWPAITSHALLERLGVIHQVNGDHDHHHPNDASAKHEHEHEPHSENHEFAHGDYFAKLGSDGAPSRVDLQIYEIALVPIHFQRPADCRNISLLGPAPPGTSPPELLHRWNFILRTAVDARAPSFLS